MKYAPAILVFVVALVDAALTVSIAVPYGVEANPVARALCGSLGLVGYCLLRPTVSLVALVFARQLVERWPYYTIIAAHLALLGYWVMFLGAWYS